MKIQNSYIFLPKSQKRVKLKENKDGKMHFEFVKSVHSILKQSFNFASDDVSQGGYFQEEIRTIIQIDDIDFEVSFSINKVAENTFLDITVSNNIKLQAVKCLEYINQILDVSDIEEHYIVIISYDAVSEYYCNKIYPKLNELERTLRKLLFNIYIVNFGRAYYTKTVKPELQSKIKGVVQAKGNDEKKEIERLKKFFYSFEYIDIQTMLFEERWTSLEEQKKSNFLNNYSDLAVLGDEQIRKAFENICPKSDWERFFTDKIPNIDVKSLIDEIRLSRNNIAHCKFFYKQEYQECANSIMKLKKAINKAIKLTEEKDFVQKNTESLKARLAEFQKNIAVTFAPILKRNVEIQRVLQSSLEKFSKLSVEWQRIAQTMDLSALSKFAQLSASVSAKFPFIGQIESPNDDETGDI